MPEISWYDLYVLKRKSENMNLKFKSSEPDLKFNIQSQFRILNQNVLYLTREVDKLVRMVNTITIDQNLQKTVDDYFEKDPFGSQFRTANRIKEEENDSDKDDI